MVDPLYSEHLVYTMHADSLNRTTVTVPMLVLAYCACSPDHGTMSNQQP